MVNTLAPFRRLRTSGTSGHGSSLPSVCQLFLSSPSKSRGDVATPYVGICHHPHKTSMCVPSWMSRCLVKSSPQCSIFARNVPGHPVNTRTGGSLWIMNGGLQGWLRNPIGHSVCASWLALDGHLELLLPTIDASHFVWVPGWNTEVLACLQACPPQSPQACFPTPENCSQSLS